MDSCLSSSVIGVIWREILLVAYKTILSLWSLHHCSWMKNLIRVLSNSNICSFLFKELLPNWEYTNCLPQKIPETDLIAGVLKKDQKHKRLNRILFNHTKQDSVQIFKGNFFFKATNKTKTDSLADVDWVLPEGCVHETDMQVWRAHILLEEPNRRQLSCPFVFVLFVTLKKRIPSKMCVLSCFVLSKSVLFNILCVFEEKYLQNLFTSSAASALTTRVI